MARTNALNLATILEAQGYRVQIVEAEPPMLMVSGVNIWADRCDRYPWTTVYEPLHEQDAWEWGPNFEYQAEPDTETDNLAARVVATMKAQP